MKMLLLRPATCLVASLLATVPAFAQPGSTPATEPDTEVVETAPVLDDFAERNVVTERPVLPYAPVREADILWEKRLWRVVDTREKMNLPFVSPNAPLFTIFSNAALNGELTVYSTEDDKFSKPLTVKELNGVLFEVDTLSVFDPVDYTETVQVVKNDLNWEDVKRYRIKEAWWFDTRTSTLRQRILGIAPMVDVLDEQGNFRFEKPLFWVHYPTARPLLAHNKAFVSGDNVATTLSWEDVFEMRHFASYVTKESNTHDRRISDYLTGVDLLLESQSIEDQLFNREHDLWAW